MQHNVLNSPRLREFRRLRRQHLQNKILYVLVFLLALYVGLGFLARIKKLNIAEVAISGNKIVDAAAVQTAVENDLLGYYLLFYPKTDIFIFPKSLIQKDLMAQFKRIASVEASVDDNKVLQITLSERTAAYSWCGAMPPASPGDAEDCRFMDKSGFVFDAAPYFSGEVYFKFYGNLNKVGFGSLVSFKNTLDAMALKPTAMYVEEGGEVLVYLPPGTPGGAPPEIRFLLSDNLETVAENLQAALTTDPLQVDFKKNYNTLSYIDLRFGNKVYYKFQ